jgi:alkanesulfonate monooxygenase SsuD/methylene tetrahydromethanopterin reductase-like flavin-dependent oxidoreductase (luciferase family)
MWTEDSPEYVGKYYSIDKAAAPPKPSVVPPICIGAYGEQIGLPLVGRLADVWNSSLQGDESKWIKKRDIVRASAERAGRDPLSVEISLTIERPLPTNTEESERYVTDLLRLENLGVSHFVMDFGHPTSTEPVMRFVDEVIKKVKRT